MNDGTIKVDQTSMGPRLNISLQLTPEQATELMVELGVSRLSDGEQELLTRALARIQF